MRPASGLCMQGRTPDDNRRPLKESVSMTKAQSNLCQVAVAACLLVAGASEAQQAQRASAATVRVAPDMTVVSQTPEIRASQLGTRDSPFVVDQVESKEESDRKASEVERSRITLGVSIVGLLIAVAQAGFFVYQLRLMRVNVRDTTDAAKAAKDAADIATYETRPWMSYSKIQIINNYGPGPKGKSGRVSTTFIFRWRNTGRSPAFRARVSAFSQNRKLAEAAPVFIPIFDGMPSDLLGDMTIETPVTVEAELIEALKYKKTRLYMFCAMEYEWNARPKERFMTTIRYEVAVRGTDADGNELYTYIDLGAKIL